MAINLNELSRQISKIVRIDSMEQEQRETKIYWCLIFSPTKEWLKVVDFRYVFLLLPGKKSVVLLDSIIWPFGQINLDYIGPGP